MPKESGRKLIAQNKKARHDYHLDDHYEAGLVLTGTEVKSLRAGRASLVDAYARILLLTKQLGSVRPLAAEEMKELLDLKSKFGMSDPRTDPGASPEKLACAGTDFISRVGGEVGARGKMVCGEGTAPVCRPTSSMEQSISSLIPPQYSESDIENLVQTITDQIMEAV